MPRHPTESHPTDNRVKRVKSNAHAQSYVTQYSAALVLRHAVSTQNQHENDQKQVNEDGALFPQPKGQQQHPNSLCVPLYVLYHCVLCRSYQLVLLLPIRIRRYVAPCCVALAVTFFSRASVRTTDRLSLTKQDSIHWGLKSRHCVTQPSTFRRYVTKYITPTNTVLRNEVHIGIQYFGTRSSQAFIQDPSTGDSTHNTLLRNIDQHRVT